MSKRKARTILHTNKPLIGWEMAVSDAQEMVKQAEKRLLDLKAALAVCVERRDSGEPWLTVGNQRQKQLAREQ